MHFDGLGLIGLWKFIQDASSDFKLFLDDTELMIWSLFAEELYLWERGFRLYFSILDYTSLKIQYPGFYF